MSPKPSDEGRFAPVRLSLAVPLLLGGLLGLAWIQTGSDRGTWSAGSAEVSDSLFPRGTASPAETAVEPQAWPAGEPAAEGSETERGETERCVQDPLASLGDARRAAGFEASDKGRGSVGRFHGRNTDVLAAASSKTGKGPGALGAAAIPSACPADVLTLRARLEASLHRRDHLLGALWVRGPPA